MSKTLNCMESQEVNKTVRPSVTAT